MLALSVVVSLYSREPYSCQILMLDFFFFYLKMLVKEGEIDCSTLLALCSKK